MADCVDYLWVFILVLQIFVWFILYYNVFHCGISLPLQTNDVSTDDVRVCTGKSSYHLVPAGNYLFRFRTNLFLAEMLRMFQNLVQPSEPKCTTTNHARTFSLLTGHVVWDGSKKVNTGRRSCILEYCLFLCNTHTKKTQFNMEKQWNWHWLIIVGIFWATYQAKLYQHNATCTLRKHLENTIRLHT